MTDLVTPNKGLTEPTVGGDNGTWGGILNTDLGLVDTAFGGVTNLSSTGGTLALSQAQLIPPNIIISGALTSNLTYTTPSGVGGQWSIANKTTGAFTVTISSLAGGSSVTIPQNERLLVITDGTSSGIAQSTSPTPPTVIADLTFNNVGSGATSPAIYNGGSAKTISYNTIGALSTNVFAGSSQQLSPRGYQKFPGGLILQWGTLPAQADSAYHSFLFTSSGGIAFPNACWNIQTSVYQDTQNTGIAGATTTVVSVQGLTATGFSYIMSSNWNIGGDTGVPVYWFAIGN